MNAFTWLVTQNCRCFCISRGSWTCVYGNLWALLQGVVLVATSNRQPDSLYEGGLQRTLFLPFIKRLKARRLPSLQSLTSVACLPGDSVRHVSVVICDWMDL